MSPNKIAVIGIGTVGSAIADGFEGMCHEIYRHDPDKDYHDTIDDVDVLFICIYDAKYVPSVVRHYQNSAKVIVIKTTCAPGTTEKIIKKYGDHIVFSPEFLCEKTSHYDFLNPDKIVFGTENQDAADYLIELFLPFNARILVMHPTEAEILKISINTFYGIKVSFANEVADLCIQHGIDYEKVQIGMEDDRFIAANHLDIWHNEYRGYGGKCIPKDVGIFIDAADEAGSLCTLSRTADATNDLRRDRGIHTGGLVRGPDNL